MSFKHATGWTTAILLFMFASSSVADNADNRQLECDVSNHGILITSGDTRQLNRDGDWPRNFGRTAGLVFAMLCRPFPFLEPLQEVG
jgi:hypothetical protein